MLALSIRQPFAELILRGIKTVKYRTRPTRIVGERFWLYASKGQGARGKGQAIWSTDLSTGGTPVPQWMLELAEQIKLIPADLELPTGVIVGSAVIEQVSQVDDTYRWHLTDVQRSSRHRKPARHPQPVWFRPFD